MSTFSEEDLNDVIDLVNNNIEEKYTPSIYLDMSSAWREGFILARENGRLVGLIFAIPAEPRIARIIIFCVDQPYQGIGIGSALLEELDERITKFGYISQRLEVKIDNTPVIDFYTKRGFKITETLKEFYNSGADAFRMMKPY